MASLGSLRIAAVVGLAVGCGPSWAAFESGGTGVDGAFAPVADMVVALPPGGVLNYQSINIPAGVTVRFQKNAANTPVTLLVKGDVTIAGTIDLSGGAGMNASGPVVLGVSNKNGTGGPGGFDGGMGGAPETNRNASAGLGPGGGLGGTTTCGVGAGGGFATANGTYGCSVGIAATYGSNTMLPVIGGSGGGGGAGGSTYDSYAGAGGGGGGGALLLVASGSVALTGQILANGGKGGDNSANNGGSAAGGGAGGMVRILATGYTGAGTISVSGGIGGCPTCTYGLGAGGSGGVGRKSVEVVPNGGVFSQSSLPTLAITTIDGMAVPANPTGSADVTVPMADSNPITVTVSATGVPIGTAVKLTLSDSAGNVVTATTSALSGTLQVSSASGSISIPGGSSVLMASTTFAVTLAQGEALSIYAQGERVEKVTLAAALGGTPRATLITATGKEYAVPVAVLALLPS